ALADAFTVCDGYHSSVMGPTHPNRVMAMSGTLDPHGLGGGPVLDSSAPKQLYTWTTYPERLQRAGVSWRYFTAYPYDTGHGWFKNFAEAQPGDPLYDNAMVAYSPSMVADVIRRGELPSVTWLDAQYLPSVYGLPEGAEGPGRVTAGGVEYMTTILDALASTPEVWQKTMMVITYDENDGRFDHVAPPVPPPGTADEFVTVSPLPASAEGIDGPIGLGFRVPTLVISPFSQGGWVCSETFDHTSTLRFLERRFGVMEPNISAWRRRTVGDLTSALRLDGTGLRSYPKGIPTNADAQALYALEVNEAATLPPPVIPTNQTVPHQEPGTRPHTS
ncbi:MAG: phospholipase C, phosphocholine-specific, partial [Microlunatus sp.]|nr:phospholipase C, phosphocholine-specific [Microlunatus sp.]